LVTLPAICSGCGHRRSIVDEPQHRQLGAGGWQRTLGRPRAHSDPDSIVARPSQKVGLGEAPPFACDAESSDAAGVALRRAVPSRLRFGCDRAIGSGSSPRDWPTNLRPTKSAPIAQISASTAGSWFLRGPRTGLNCCSSDSLRRRVTSPLRFLPPCPSSGGECEEENLGGVGDEPRWAAAVVAAVPQCHVG
jgi:hypothetical protein